MSSHTWDALTLRKLGKELTYISAVELVHRKELMHAKPVMDQFMLSDFPPSCPNPCWQYENSCSSRRTWALRAQWRVKQFNVDTMCLGPRVGHAIGSSKFYSSLESIDPSVENCPESFARLCECTNKAARLC